MTESVGTMDNAYFTSGKQILSWICNNFTAISKIEHASNGALYCQILERCHPGVLNLKRVNFNARTNFESLPNYKILQKAFSQLKILRRLDVERLQNGKFQDNLEFLQWFKRYYELTAPKNPLNANNEIFSKVNHVARAAKSKDHLDLRYHRSLSKNRLNAKIPSSVEGIRLNNLTTLTSKPLNKAEDGGQQVISEVLSEVERQKLNDLTKEKEDAELEIARLKENQAKLKDETVDLKNVIVYMKRERDFFYSKLRDIEVLLNKDKLDRDMIQQILWSEKELEVIDDGGNISLRVISN